MITVVKINKAQDNFTNYIGREWAGLPASKFGNPFHIGKDGNREEVLAKFIAYWYSDAQRSLRIWALQIFPENGVLGCWCKPALCHGDIIADYVNFMRKKQANLFATTGEILVTEEDDADACNHRP